jgi:N utilization substance protein B
MAEAADEVRVFANELVVGTISNLNEIDDRIRLRTEHWRIPRMAIVDRNLLRMAVYEFIYQPNTPKTVAINEALEIARRFSTHEATQFINGILDAIKRDLETQVVPEATAASLA